MHFHRVTIREIIVTLVPPVVTFPLKHKCITKKCSKHRVKGKSIENEIVFLHLGNQLLQVRKV